MTLINFLNLRCENLMNFNLKAVRENNNSSFPRSRFLKYCQMAALSKTPSQGFISCFEQSRHVLKKVSPTLSKPFEACLLRLRKKTVKVEQWQSTESEKLKIRKVESGKVESRDSEVESGQRERFKFCKAYKQAAEVPCRRFAGRAQRGSRSYSAFLTNRRSGGEAAAEAESGRH